MLITGEKSKIGVRAVAFVCSSRRRRQRRQRRQQRPRPFVCRENLIKVKEKALGQRQLATFGRRLPRQLSGGPGNPNVRRKVKEEGGPRTRKKERKRKGQKGPSRSLFSLSDLFTKDFSGSMKGDNGEIKGEVRVKDRMKEAEGGRERKRKGGREKGRKRGKE
jgi:hypothetical protein